MKYILSPSAICISTERMARMFRENPSDIAFPEAVDLFSARSRFVREGSNSCMVSGKG